MDIINVVLINHLLSGPTERVRWKERENTKRERERKRGGGDLKRIRKDEKMDWMPLGEGKNLFRKIGIWNGLTC